MHPSRVAEDKPPEGRQYLVVPLQDEKTSGNFLAMIKLASVRMWIEFYESAA